MDALYGIVPRLHSAAMFLLILSLPGVIAAIGLRKFRSRGLRLFLARPPAAA